MTIKATTSILLCMTLGLFLSAQNIVPVTFTVDLSEQAAPSQGVFVIGNFFNGSAEPLDDNGDGTWSYSASFTIGDTLFYRFALDQELETINNTSCLYTDALNRWMVVPDMDTVFAVPVCFNHCVNCAEVTTSVNELLLTEWQFKLSPNPMEASTRAYWKNQEKAISRIQLYSIDGQLLQTYSVQNQSEVTIQRGTLVPGIYFLSIKDTTGRTGVQKMIVK